MRKDSLEVPQIYCTNDYNMFKISEYNRDISSKKVDVLVHDPLFEMNYHTVPIIITRDNYIVDGQHRLTALKLMNKPIYYMYGEGDLVLQMMKRNAQMDNWKQIDYVNVNKEIPSYRYLSEWVEKFSVTISFVNSSVMYLCSFSPDQYARSLKSGTLDIIEHVEEIEEFLSIYSDLIRRIHASKSQGKIQAAQLRKAYYINAFGYFFQNDRKVFDLAIARMEKMSCEIPAQMNSDRAREQVLIFSKWTDLKEKQFKEGPEKRKKKQP